MKRLNSYPKAKMHSTFLYTQILHRTIQTVQHLLIQNRLNFLDLRINAVRKIYFWVKTKQFRSSLFHSEATFSEANLMLFQELL